MSLQEPFNEACMKRPHKTPTLLLVEDDETDVFLVKRMLAKHGGTINIVVARDGEEALEFLSEGGNVDKPYVILSDLNMPGMSGYEFLEALRADDRLKDSVVFVFSSSVLSEDIDRAYAKTAAGYLIKDINPSKMTDALNLVFDYCCLVRLPE